MVTSPDLLNKEGAPPPGRLIDVDLACIYGDLQSGAPWRAGTYLYMAINILQQHHPRHNPWHDIESVFWVLLFGELNRTPYGARRLMDIASYAPGLSSEAARASKLAESKAGIVGMYWPDWMGHERPSLFGKTSFPVIRLMHRLRIELFEFHEKEHHRLGTVKEVAKAAKERVVMDLSYDAPRFAVTEEEVVEEPRLEERIEELNLEKNVEELNLKKDIGKLNLGEGIEDLVHEEYVGECNQGTSIEKLKQAVITVTERIEGWFTECIENMPNH
jgi:hypothetical protein